MKNIVENYFHLSDVQKQKIYSMYDIYHFWNNKVNLISRRDFIYFYEKHVLHSLSIAKVFKFKKDTQVMDLGTGGGFPGVPLAIFFPNVHFQLVDSILKKTTALKSIVNDLQLDNVSIVNKRAEDVNNCFDFIVTRAVAKLEKLNKWTEDKILVKNKHSFKNGLICLKGGTMDDEVKNNLNRITIYEINKLFKEDFFSEKKIIHLYK